MREVVSLVFGIREAKLTIAKDEGGKVDFFLGKIRGEMRSVGIRLIYTEGPTSSQPKAVKARHGPTRMDDGLARRPTAGPTARSQKLTKNPVPRRRFK